MAPALCGSARAAAASILTAARACGQKDGER